MIYDFNSYEKVVGTLIFDNTTTVVVESENPRVSRFSCEKKIAKECWHSIGAYNLDLSTHSVAFSDIRPYWFVPPGTGASLQKCANYVPL